MEIALSALPRHWERIPDEGRHSTVAFFESGCQSKESNDEVLVWRGPSTVYGITEDGEILTGEPLDAADESQLETVGEGADFEGFPSQGPEDKYTYLVEYHPEAGDVSSELASGEEEVSEIVERFLTTAGALGA